MINKCEKCELPFHSTCFPAKQVDGQRTCCGCAPVPLLAPPDQQCGGNFLHCKAFIGDRIEAAFLKVHGAAKGPSAIKRLGEYTGSRGYHKWKCSSGCYHGNLKTRVFTMGAQQVMRQFDKRTGRHNVTVAEIMVYAYLKYQGTCELAIQFCVYGADGIKSKIDI